MREVNAGFAGGRRGRTDASLSMPGVAAVNREYLPGVGEGDDGGDSGGGDGGGGDGRGGGDDGGGAGGGRGRGDGGGIGRGRGVIVSAYDGIDWPDINTPAGSRRGKGAREDAASAAAALIRFHVECAADSYASGRGNKLTDLPPPEALIAAATEQPSIPPAPPP